MAGDDELGKAVSKKKRNSLSQQDADRHQETGKNNINWLYGLEAEKPPEDVSP